MSIEHILLKDQIYPKETCPKCYATGINRPEYQFLRGMVQRNKYFLGFLWKRKYCAVICFNCKEIIGWESPEDYWPNGVIPKEDYMDALYKLHLAKREHGLH